MIRILWIPHQSWLSKGGITRDKHLIMNLKEKHEIHVIQHTQPYQNNVFAYLNPKNLFNSIKEWDYYENGIFHHHIKHLYFTRFKPILAFNNKIFRRKIKEIVNEYKIDILICGPNHYLHGYPPFKELSIPIVFDYLDYLYDFHNPYEENTAILTGYYENSSKILCVSKKLMEDIPKEHKDKAIYLPNGVDLDYYKSYNYQKKTNIIFISLIGLNISESLFYLNIFPKIKDYYKNAKMLLVGGGIRYPFIKKYIQRKKNPSDYILTGFIPYEKIRKYFYMTDVGLNPTLQNRYYHSACPLKVMEYSAAKKPVVSTELEELRKLDFPNVFLAQPNSKSFLKNVIKALEYDGPFPDLELFDWKNLSDKLEKTLKEL